MPMLIQFCAVIVTMALVVIAYATVRALQRIERAADTFVKSADALRETAGEIRNVARNANGVVTELGSALPKVRTSLMRFAGVADRIGRLSENVVEEVEAPVRNTVALLHGVRTGTGFLIERLVERITRRRSAATNGGYRHA